MNNYLSILINTIGLGVLFASWSGVNKLDQRNLLNTLFIIIRNVLAWSLVILSVYLLIQEHGIEFGVIYGALMTNCISLIYVSINGELRKSNIDTQTLQPYQLLSRRKVIFNSMNTLMVIPMSGIASIMLSLYTCQFFFVDTANHLLYMVFAFPIIWAVMVVIYSASNNKLPISIGISLTALSLSYITFT